MLKKVMEFTFDQKEQMKN